LLAINGVLIKNRLEKLIDGLHFLYIMSARHKSAPPSSKHKESSFRPYIKLGANNRSNTINVIKGNHNTIGCCDEGKLRGKVFER
jgi:hypothetical protein